MVSDTTVACKVEKYVNERVNLIFETLDKYVPAPGGPLRTLLDR